MICRDLQLRAVNLKSPVFRANSHVRRCEVQHRLSFSIEWKIDLEFAGRSAQYNPTSARRAYAKSRWLLNDGTARVWAVHEGRPVELLCLGHDGEVYSAVFSSCSSLLVTASQDGTACLWCSHTGRRHWHFPHGAEVYLATFSFDDQWVLTSSADGAACIVSVSTGELAARLEGHTGGVNRAEFSPVGTLVVTASSTTVRLWDGMTSTCLHEVIGDSELKFVNFSSDGQLVLATRASGSAEVWVLQQAN